MNNALLIENNKYLLMVIVSTYNHECYIEDCLKGIVMQKTTFPFVAVVLDDCSTDGTKEIIQQYESLHPELIKGVYFVENQYSQGKNTMNIISSHIGKVKYFALCEGDDYWIDPLKLQKQVDYMEGRSKCTLCFHNSIMSYEKRNSEDKLFSKIENREYSGYEIFKEWIVPTASVMIRVNVLNDVSSIDKISNPLLFYTDIALFLLCASKGEIYGMSDVMSVYRRNENSFTAVKDKNQCSSITINKKLCDHYLVLSDLYTPYFGKKFREACKTKFFQYNRYGLYLSLLQKEYHCYEEFLANSFQMSLHRTLFNVLYSFLMFVKHLI